MSRPDSATLPAPTFGPSPLRGVYRDFLARREQAIVLDLLEQARREVRHVVEHELQGEQILPELLEFRMR